ncbi:MAG: hypothetical protein HOW73_09670 [Polyangiaceae bacterium]|nr:hypothetical protein [Polyangiaceae bacterium]
MIRDWSPPSRGRYAAALVLGIASACVLVSACSEPSEIVFGITSELAPGATFTSLSAKVDVDGREVFTDTFDGARLRFPLELSITDIAGDSDVNLELVAMQGQVPILTKSASTTAAEGRKMLYEVKLESECVAVECDEGTTCADAVCSDPFTDPADLPEFYDNWAGGSSGGLCEPGGEPEVILGEGQADFHNVDEGEVLQVEAGPQGGYHVWIAARMKNLTQSGSVTTLTGRFPALDYEPQPSVVIFTFDPDEGGYCKIYGLRFRLDDEQHPVESLLGQELEVTVSITDQSDDTASATRTVRLSDDFI